MAGQNQIKFGIGFSVDKSGLNEMQSLFQQIANRAKEPGQNISAELKKAGQTAQTLDSILEKTFNSDLGTLNVIKFNQELNKSGLTLKQVQSDLSKIGNQGANAYNRLSQAVLGTNLQLKQSSKLLDDMATSMANTVKWGITSSIFNNITSSIQKAVDYSRKLNSSLNDIRIVTDKSAESMEKFAEKANEGAQALGASTLDYTNASLIYYQQGLEDAEVQARTETTLKAANVTGQSASAVSEQLTAVWNGYKVTAEETELYVDKLAAVAASTASDLEELSKGMSKVASAANSMGVDVDQLNAQLATIISVTRQAPENVGTALKTIYARLGDLKVDGVDEFGTKLGEVSAQMQTMGIQILDQNGDLRDMGQVMEDVASKWNIWTEAQKQAAAVAMAGKRQYNNLIALFENWDMYTKSLQTSADAMGTLQKQQDTYMESTSAKLKQLKAAWEGVYGDLVDDDDINKGIASLTVLVDLLDKFIKSFGGGSKAIMGFGAIVANIFNKQISEGINNALNRQKIYQQNLEALKLKSEAISNGAVQSTGNQSLDKGIESNTRTQLEYAEKIYKLRSGMTTEQYNQLTNQQKLLGGLAQEKTYLEEETIRINQSKLENENILDLLSREYNELEEIASKKESIVVTTQEELSKIQEAIKNAPQVTENYSIIQDRLDDIVSSTGRYEEKKKEILNILGQINEVGFEGYAIELKETKNAEEFYSVAGGILAEIEKITGSEEESLNFLSEEEKKAKEKLKTVMKEAEAYRAIAEARGKITQISAKEMNIKQQVNDMLELAASNATVTQSIMGITSAVGQLTMTWSSMQSIVSAWNDEDLSFGDKIFQTLTSLTMMIPMYLTSMQKLKEITEGARAAEEAQVTALLLKKVALKEANEEEIKNLATKISTKDIDANTLIAMYQDIAAKKLDTAATDDNTRAKEVNEVITAYQKENLTEEQKLFLKSAAAKKADTIETERNTIAQHGLNTAIKANPIGAIISALMIVIALYSTYTKKIEEARKATIEESKAEIEKNNEKINEIKSNQELIKSYNETIASYKKNEISKTDLADRTEELCKQYDIENGRILALQGRYKELTKEIKEAEQAQLDELQTLAKSNVAKAGVAFRAQAANNEPFKKSSDISNYNYGGTFGVGSEDNPLQKLLTYYGQTMAVTGTLAAGGLTFGPGKAIDLGLKFGDLNKQELLPERDLTTTEGQLKHYEDLLRRRERLLSLDNTKNDEEVKLLNQQIEGYEEYVNTIIEGQKQITQANIKETFNQIGLSDETNYDNFVKNYEEILSKANDEIDKELYGASKEEIENAKKENKEYLDSLIKQYEEAAKLLDQKGFIDSIKESFKDNSNNIDIEQWLKDNIYSDKEKGIAIAAYLQLNGNETQAEIDAELERATAQYESVQRQDRITKLNTAMDSISKGEDAALILSNLDDVIAEYANFYGIQEKGAADQLDLIQDYYNYELDHIRENTEAQIEANNKLIEAKRNELENLKALDQSLFTEKEKEETSQRIAQLEEQIEALTNQNYEINLHISDDITNQLIGMSNNIIALSQAISDASEGIGENFTVAADGVQKLADTFPELFEGATMLENGVVQLKEETVKEVLGADAEMLASDDKLVKNKIKNRIIELDTEIKQTERQIEIAQELSDGEISIEEATEKAKANGLTEYGDFVIKSYNEWLEDNAKTNKQMAEDHHEMTKSMIDDINAIGSAWAAAQEAKRTGNYNKIEIEEKASYAGGDYEEIVNSINEETKDELEKNLTAISDYSKAYGQAQVEALKAYKDGLENDRADLYAALSKMEAKTTDAAKKLKDAQSGKGNKEKKEKEKKNDDEFDRYWDIKKAIDAVDRALNELSKDQENLFGYELADSLMRTNELLDQQAANYARLAEEQRKEASELQNVLSGMGVTFDASGAITNYAAATSAALAQYNEAIAKYNAGLIDEASLKIYETQYELFKKQLERYDQLFYTEMKETQEKLKEIERQKKANNLKAWQVKLEVKLELKELKREWNSFLGEINKDFKSVYKDLRTEVDVMKKNASTYTGSKGTINQEIKAIEKVEKEIDKMKNGGSSKMFESISQAQEELKKLNEKLLNDAQALHDLWVQAWQAYLDGIEQVKGQLDEVIERYGRIREQLNFLKELNELVYGPKNFENMNTYYDQAIKNNNSMISSIVDMKNKMEGEFDTMLAANGHNREDWEKWSEDEKSLYEEIVKLQNDLNDAILDGAQLLKDQFNNSLNEAMNLFEHTLYGDDFSLDGWKEEWEQVNKLADKYLDTTTRIYETATLNNKFTKSLNDYSGNIKAQEKILELQQTLNDELAKKDELTQYDIDKANLRYELMLKEIALEDAQNNKTSMKVVRNEEGNWSYQYVADEDNVLEKQQQVLDLKQQLYELAEEYKASIQESIANLDEYYMSQMQHIQELENNGEITHAEAESRKAKLNDYYTSERAKSVQQLAEVTEDMEIAALAVTVEAASQSADVYDTLSESQRKAVDLYKDHAMTSYEDITKVVRGQAEEQGLIDDQLAERMKAAAKDVYDETEQRSSDTLNVIQTNADQVDTAVSNLMGDITQATRNYQDGLDDLQDSAGMNFEEIQRYMQDTETETDNLNEKASQLASDGVDYIDQLREAAEELEEAWNSVKDAIEEAIEKLEEYLRLRGEAGSGGTDGLAPTSSGTGGTATPTGTGKNDDSSSPKSSGESSSPDSSTGEKGSGWVVRDQEDSRIIAKGLSWTDAMEWVKRGKNNKPKPAWAVSGSKTVYYKSGGYTGSWSGADTEENGRLAMLHQKELVLNADDTKNMLDAVGIVRALSSFISATTAGLAATSTPGVYNNSTSNSSNSYGDVIINASFPNANDVNAIKEAILNLPNLAAQYFAENRK